MELIPVLLIAAAAIGVAAFFFFRSKQGKGLIASVTPAPDRLVTVSASTPWNIQHSPGMPPQTTPSNGGWSFEFPVGPEALGAASVHYVSAPASGHLSGARLEMDFTIEAAGNPAFQYKLNSDNTCVNPANVSMYLQRRNDQLTAAYEHYRWWSDTSIPLLPGAFSLTVPLSPGNWSQVYGKNGTAYPHEFAAALADLEAVGVTFGGGCFKGHGVNLSQGTAKFTMTRFEVKN